jgi:hypothetical protein
MVTFTIDTENDLLPSGSSGGEGLTPGGQFWFFDGTTTSTLTATTAGGQTGGGLVGHSIAANASIIANLSPSGIAASGSALVTAPFNYEADFLQASVSFSLTLTIAEPTTFSIEQTGFFSIADFSPITGSINGNQLTAGTYRLSLGMFASFTGAGQTIDRDGTFNVIFGGGADCPADWNDDGSVNSSDISAFLSAWLGSLQNGDLIADFNDDGHINSADIAAFLVAWIDAVGGGCDG